MVYFLQDMRQGEDRWRMQYRSCWRWNHSLLIGSQTWRRKIKASKTNLTILLLQNVVLYFLKSLSYIEYSRHISEILNIQDISPKYWIFKTYLRNIVLNIQDISPKYWIFKTYLRNIEFSRHISEILNIQDISPKNWIFKTYLRNIE